MKQKNVYKLALRRETISDLNKDSLEKVNGGLCTIDTSCACSHICSEYLDTVCKCMPTIDDI
jgi:hypothetical protein